MNDKERNFINSIKTKINKYSIPTTVRKMLNKASGTFVETTYNDGRTELVDVAIERELCKLSSYYFIANYGLIHFPGVGVIPYDLYYFQREILKDTEKFKKLVFLKSRQAGISTLFSLYAFWLGNFRGSENIDVVSIKQKKAQAFTKKMFPTMDNIPDFLKTQVVKKNMAEIEWANGSYMLSESASDKAGRGDSLSLLILDELAFYRSDSLTRGIVSAAQPTLTRTGGQQVLISCVVGETYLFTNKGLKKMEDLAPKKVEPGFNLIPVIKLDGLEANQPCNLFFDSGKSDTIKITTKLGYELEGTPLHPILTYDKNKTKERFNWKRLTELEKGSLVALKEGSNIFGTNNKFAGITLNEKTAFVLGSIFSRGKINENGDEISVVCKKNYFLKYRAFIKSFGGSFKKKNDVVHIKSGNLVELLRNSGLFGSEVPKELLEMNRKLTLAFLKGFFKSSPTEGLLIKKPEALKQIQLMALNFGSITRRTNKYIAIAFGFSFKFHEYFIDEIVKIEHFKDRQTYDFFIPRTNTFISNGIVSHNCVVGDTYVNTGDGLQQVSDFIPADCKPGFNKIEEIKIDGINHQQKTNTFYDSGFTPTKRITFGPNTTNDISEIHPFYIIDETSCFPYWKQAKNIKVGDYSLASLREKTFGNFERINKSKLKKMNESTSYLFGLLLGNGSLDKKNREAIIYSRDEEIKNFLLSGRHLKAKAKSEDGVNFVFKGKYIINYLDQLGFNSTVVSEDIKIPKKLLQMNRRNTVALLRGLFDAYGYSKNTDGTIGFITSSVELAKQIKLLLDMLGIQASDEEWEERYHDKFVRFTEGSFSGRIVLSKYFSKVFYEKIGFSISRKQKNYKLVKHIQYPALQVYPGLGSYVAYELFKKNNAWNEEVSKIINLEENNNLTRYKLKECLELAKEFTLENTEEYKRLEDFYDKDWYPLRVKEIISGKANTYDFVIPETKSFYINGVIGSNTPNGLSGTGSYYAEQVQQLQIAGDETETEKLITIDWFEIPDLPGIYPQKGYNEELQSFIDKDYYRNKRVRKEMNAFFKPIADNPMGNPFLKKAHDDLGEVLYRQEIEHDFIVSGDQVFSEEVLEGIKEGIKDPITKNKLGRSRANGLYIWEHPVPKKRYIIGVDVSTGTGNDYSTFQIMDVENYQQVAEYKGQMATKTFGQLLKKAANYYNEAFVVIECNSIGEAVFNEVYYSEENPYTNVYKQRKTTKDGRSRVTGWETNVKTRQLMINNLIDYFTVKELSSAVKVYSERMYTEMLSFVWINGKAMHTSNGHDDTLIAFGLCLYFRNKANTIGESFLINEDGDFIGTDNMKDVSNMETKESGFGIVSSDDPDTNSFEDVFGMSKEDYDWIIG